MRKLMHDVAHLLGWNHGRVETWWDPDCLTGRLMVGFKCAKCGRVTGAQEIYCIIRRPK